MNALTNALFAFAAQKQIDLTGVTTAEPVHCLPWAYDTDETQNRPCEPSKIAPDTYDPERILPGARSVIMAGMYMYGFDHLIASEPGCPRGNIGPWTRGYVEAGRYAADSIAAWLTARGYCAVFTNALPYRTLAVRSGIGRIGNNGFLYHEAMGCYLRLTCVVTDALLTPYQGPPMDGNDCGACRLCAKSCPTGALRGPRDYCADDCLHLWLQGQGSCADGIPPEKRHMCRNYLMRTGLCLSVCRRNRNLKPRASFPFQAEQKEDSPALIPLVTADEAAYMSRLPYHVYKYGIRYIRRNVILALGNAADPAAVPALREGLHSLTPDCRALCAWALGEIGTKQAEEALLEREREETEPAVLAELRQAKEKITGKHP